MSGNSHSAIPIGFLLIDIYIIYMMILIERWMPHRTEQFSIVMFDSKRLSLNLNPWSVWTFQEDDILQLSLMQGNFGFIQTMRAMDQKSTGWSWYSQWSCVLHIGYALYALFISCPSNFSVFIWLGVSDAPGTGEAGAWVWDTPAVDNGPVNWWVFPGSVWNGAFFGCPPQKSDQSIRTLW